MLNKITGYGPVKSAGGTKKAGSTVASSSFADLLSGTDEASATAPLSNVSATSAIGNMLALQEISDEDVRRRKLMQQGKSMLDTLEKLRQSLLAGIIPGHMLQDLSRQLSIQRQAVVDPELMELMDDIELRVAVELAKLEGAFSQDV